MSSNTVRVQNDFNGDGYGDLAVGAPYAAGAVVVLHGGPGASVSTTRRAVITQSTAGIPGDPETGDGFGRTVTSADLDRDGYADGDGRTTCGFGMSLATGDVNGDGKAERFWLPGFPRTTTCAARCPSTRALHRRLHVRRPGRSGPPRR